MFGSMYVCYSKYNNNMLHGIKILLRMNGGVGKHRVKKL